MKSESVDSLMHRVSEWISDRSPVEDDVQSALKTVAANNAAKLSLFRHVLTMKSAQHITTLNTALDVLFEKLLNKERLSKIEDPRALVATTSLVQELLKERTDYIDKVVKEGLDPSVQSLLHQMDTDRISDGELAEGLQKLSPQKREAMRNVLAKLETLAENGTQRNGHAE